MDAGTGIDTEDGIPGLPKFVSRLAAEIDRRGTLDVLCHGLVGHGVAMRLASFRPAHGLTRQVVQRYAANRLNVTAGAPTSPARRSRSTSTCSSPAGRQSVIWYRVALQTIALAGLLVAIIAR